MSGAVKRTYSSDLRATQARDTRKSIVSAGARLYTSQGFGRTTIDEIAAAAGVSRKTVFTSVGGKVELLKLAIDWAIAGDDEPVALRDRPVIQQAEAMTDPDELIAHWAHLITTILSRTSGLMLAATVAAGIDPDAATLLARWHANRRVGASGFVHRLAAVGGLRPGLDLEQAIDIAWVFNDPTLFHRLVTERGWPVDEFEAWIRRSTGLQLTGQD